MVARAEPLLFPGRMPRSDVAFLYPRSSFLWDVPRGICPMSTEDPGAQTMDYMAAIAGLYKELVQLGNQQVDFIDEDSLTLAELRHYKAVVVSEPAIPVEGQAALAAWLKGGGPSNSLPRAQSAAQCVIAHRAHLRKTSQHNSLRTLA